MAAPLAVLAKKAVAEYAKRSARAAARSAGAKAASNNTAVATMAVTVLAVAVFVALVVLVAISGGSPRNAAALAVAAEDEEPDFGDLIAIFGATWAAYENASTQIEVLRPGCAMRAQILGGIAQEESHQGTIHGRTVNETTFDVEPPLYGIPLDGSPGVMAIADTDGGRLDDLLVWDRAVGPFQFIPTSWVAYGQDGNGDGAANPHNMFDAALAAAVHLCDAAGNIDFNADEAALRRGLFAYNRSAVYVSAVYDNIVGFDEASEAGSAAAVDGYALPVPASMVTIEQLGRSHHDYPAIDIGIPNATALYAVVGGTIAATSPDNGNCGGMVALSGDDGASYVYCHMSAVSAINGQTVEGGAQIGRSGGIPGAPGAGNTTGPHLHLSIKVGGSSRCPQALMQSIMAGSPIDPSSLPTTGCTH